MFSIGRAEAASPFATVRRTANISSIALPVSNWQELHAVSLTGQSVKCVLSRQGKECMLHRLCVRQPAKGEDTPTLPMPRKQQ